MTDEEKDKLVAEVMQGFDFVAELKKQAEKKLRMALEHQDREFWWAGGMHHGGLCACYDDKWGLSLNYIAVANKVRIPKA